jgi:hypothetical protein
MDSTLEDAYDPTVVSGQGSRIGAGNGVAKSWAKEDTIRVDGMFSPRAQPAGTIH